jgi:hypothetical protein
MTDKTHLVKRGSDGAYWNATMRAFTTVPAYGTPFNEKRAREIVDDHNAMLGLPELRSVAITSEADTPPAPAVSAPEAEKDEQNPKDAQGIKKAPLRLVPPALMLYVSKVMELGAAKYGAYNFREKAVRHSIYIEAAMRHLMALQDGQPLDPESGQPHEAHVAACMGIILDARSLGKLVDDLPPAGAAAAIIDSMTKKD